MNATFASKPDALLADARESSEDTSVRGALLVAAIAAPVVLLVSAIAHAPSVRADAELADLLCLLSLGVALPAYLALGGALLSHVRARSSRSEGRAGALDLGLLALAGVVLVGSVAATVVGSAAVFYDAGCVALAVATAGRVLEGRVEGRAARSPAVPAAAVIAAGLFAAAVRRPDLASGPLFAAFCAVPATLLAFAVARARGVRFAAVVATAVAVVLGSAVVGAATIAG